MNTLSGSDVFLRAFDPGDLPGVESWFCDPAVAPLAVPAFRKPQVRQDARLWLDNILQGGSGVNFVIADGQTGRYLGQVSLGMVDNVTRSAELSIVLDPAQQGRGYANQGAALAIRFGFEEMNLRRLWLRVSAANDRALRLYEKLGFVREGCLRQHDYRGGRYEDVILMGLLRGEWTPDGPA